MAPPAPWLLKDIHGKPTVDTELHARLGSRTGIHFLSLRLTVSLWSPPR